MYDQFLIAALENARKGSGVCAPNPAVGAVAVQNNSIIAQAWHKGAGAAHAEQELIQQFSANTPEVTVFVTLEPCNHWGRTPPCTEALIQHGIKRVVYGHRDPNPIVIQNNTPNRLNREGIECIYHPIKEIENFYRSYDYWTKTNQPWVRAKMAQTIDGKIAGLEGQRIKLSNELCAEYTHTLRYESDVILTTATTMLNDNPALNVRKNGQETGRILAVLDSQLRLNPQMQAFQKAKQSFVFYDASLPSPHQAPNISYLPVLKDGSGLQLDAVINQLGEMGYHNLLVEAGGKLFSSLHQAQLVNQTIIYLVPEVRKIAGTPAYTLDELMQEPKKIEWTAMKDNLLISLHWS